MRRTTQSRALPRLLSVLRPSHLRANALIGNSWRHPAKLCGYVARQGGAGSKCRGQLLCNRIAGGVHDCRCRVEFRGSAVVKYFAASKISQRQFLAVPSSTSLLDTAQVCKPKGRRLEARCFNQEARQLNAKPRAGFSR